MGPDFRVDIEPFNHDEWRIVWHENNVRCRPYYVKAADLSAVADRLRELLTTLVTRARKGALAGGNRAEAVPVLRELMEQGYRLYRLLFHAERGLNQKSADFIQAKLRGAPRPPGHLVHRQLEGPHPMGLDVGTAGTWRYGPDR